MESIHFCSSSSSMILFLFWFPFTALSSASVSASTFISDDIFGSRVSIGRNLLQTRKGCSVNFEFQNYTIITSKCKGPDYPPDLCCSAFKEFACPFAADLNDLTNNCAATMFSYIHLYGKYPSGIFSSECREGKIGLECSASPPAQSANVSGSKVICSPSPSMLLMLTASSLFLLFKLL